MVASNVGAEIELVDRWVAGRLAAAATALDAVSIGLSGRIYNWYAPSTGVAYPFIIYQAQSPPRVIRGVGIEEVMVDTIYVVKAVAQTSTLTALAPVAAAIHDAMVEDTGESITGGMVLTCIYENQVHLVEVEAGRQFRHLGGSFRIQAKAA